jgi:hypothetical protein
MKQTTVIAIVLGILVLISAVQAFQLNGLKEKVVDGELSIGTASSGTPVASSGGSGSAPKELPKSLQDLPTMVGGC